MSGRGLPRLWEIARSMALPLPDAAFYFLRHGQTARNAQRVFQALDEPLDATGLAQAEAAGPLLAMEQVSSICCSDTWRVQQTAAAVARSVPVAPAPSAALRERNFGELIGTSSVDLDWDCAPVGGERLEAFVLRSRDGLQQALSQPAPVLVIAHGGTLHVLAALLNVPLTPALLANARPLRFERRADEWTISALDHEQRISADGVNLA